MHDSGMLGRQVVAELSRLQRSKPEVCTVWGYEELVSRFLCGAFDVSGNEAMVKCLLEEGADASKTDARGMTPLAHAAQGGKLYVVRVLLKAKAVGSRYFSIDAPFVSCVEDGSRS